MTIVILFHLSNDRTFKHFYSFVQQHHKKDFRKRISYSRFVYIMKNLLVPLFAYLLHTRGAVTGFAFIDSTSIKVCHNKRISRNKGFKSIAKRGKTTLLTPGNSSDIQMVETLSKGLWGKLFGDKGYISSNLAKKLFMKGIQRFIGIHSNMKQKLMHLQDKILLRKRTLIETVNDQLKTISSDRTFPS